jgi:cystathionine beta-lyase/cystathionine gamma-synthase
VTAAMTHQSVEDSDAAVPGDFVRLSCGVEAPEDLVDDLRLAFERASAGAQRSAAGQAMR